MADDWELVVMQVDGKELVERYQTKEEAKDARQDLVDQANSTIGPANKMITTKGGIISLRSSDLKSVVVRERIRPFMTTVAPRRR